MIFILILLSVFSGDLLLKKYVESRLSEQEERRIFGGKILIRKVHNHGIALGSLADHPTLVKRGTFGLILALAVYFITLLAKKGSSIRKAGIAMLLGGALCNWFDRFHQGFVTDYFSFNVKWKKLKQIVFNLSDLCIFLGAILCLFGGKGRKK